MWMRKMSKKQRKKMCARSKYLSLQRNIRHKTQEKVQKPKRIRRRKCSQPKLLEIDCNQSHVLETSLDTPLQSQRYTSPDRSRPLKSNVHKIILYDDKQTKLHITKH
eukprot:435403_1